MKCIHALLIAILCYGQLIANVHVAGHLHAPERECIQSLSFSDCGTVDHEIPGATLAVHHEMHTDSTHEGESDCAIYHVLSSLSGGFWAAQNDFDILPRLAANFSYASSYIARAVLDNQQIRAPPVIS